MRISHIEDKDDVELLSTYITRLAICMDNIEGHTERLNSFIEVKAETEADIKRLVEKWQK